MEKHKAWHGPADYQIKVKGNLGSEWSDWFEGMAIESEGGMTTITGKVLVFPTGKGSTVGSYTMYRMKKNNMAPVAIVNKQIDTIIAVGCIISEIPCVDKIDINHIKTGQKVIVNGSEGTVEVK